LNNYSLNYCRSKVYSKFSGSNEPQTNIVLVDITGAALTCEDLVSLVGNGG